MMSIDEAAHISRRKNEMQYRETLPRMPGAPANVSMTT